MVKDREPFCNQVKQAEPPEAARALARELGRQRKARGISLDEVIAKTFINKRFLEAIEAGKLEEVPGGIYLRNYLKLYARYLHFDESVVQKAFSSFPAVTNELSINFPTNASDLSIQEVLPDSTRSAKLPKFGEYLLYLFLSKSERVVVLGDLEEDHQAVKLKFGQAAADILFYKQVFTSLLYFILRSILRVVLETFDL